MKWNDVEPDISEVCINELTTGWSAIDVVSLVSTTKETPFVILPDHVREKIINHLQSKNVELGGLLVGSVISIDDLNDGLIAIVIKESVASHDFDSTSVSLSMNPTVWQSANQIGNAKTFVVGWYHSHPSLGAFFSGVDRKTQKDFFNSAYNLGLVIDPIRNEEKWFIGGESIAVNSSNVRSDLNGLAVV
jgi:proteasome lid subunit RPN8/RPN11|tara:strand:+ start:61 stop:630 length:570 start_codon:yes stop_codon:yes gene_type:complete